MPGMVRGAESNRKEAIFVDFSIHRSSSNAKTPQVLVQGLLATGMKLPEVAECCRVVAAVALLSDPELGLALKPVYMCQDGNGAEKK